MTVALRPPPPAATFPAETPPRLADGVTLIGPYLDGGFEQRRYLIRRGDGQMVLVSALLHCIAALLDGARTLEQVAAAASDAFERELTADNVRYVIETKLRPLGLIAGPAPGPPPRGPAPLLALRAKTTLLRAPAVRTVAGALAFLFNPMIIAAVLAAVVGFDVWALQHVRTAPPEALTVGPGATLTLLLLTLAAFLFHEFGHAAACRRGGGEPGEIGCGVFLIFPALFTNVTDAYRLSRWARVRTDAGGIYFNAVLVAALAPLAVWSESPALLMFALVSHALAFTQLAPMGRTDGYYLLADLVGVPDLFGRIRPILAGALRRRPPPADLTPRAQRIVIAWVVVITPLLTVLFGWFLFRLPAYTVSQAAEAAEALRRLRPSAAVHDPTGAALAPVTLMSFAALVLGLVLMAGRLLLLLGRAALGRGARAAGVGAPPAGDPPFDLTAACFTEAAMLKSRSGPGRGGWRGVVQQVSGGRLDPGPSRAQLAEERLAARLNAPIGGSRRIAVVCRKGGAGKTTTALMLGHTLAAARRDRVVALDANPDAGSLGHRVATQAAKTVTDLLADRDYLTRYADIERYSAKAPTRLDVIASDNDPRISRRLGEEEFRQIIGLLDHYYNLILADTGTGILDAAIKGVLAASDQIVVVAPPALDGARVAAATLDWLDQHGYASLVRSAVVVLNGVAGETAVELDLIEKHFAARAAAVVRIPWDPALAAGGATTPEELKPATRRAYRELAACVADQFHTRPAHRAR
ncbi:MAG: AAA family ATPase [Acidimicrobiales bacterium]